MSNLKNEKINSKATKLTLNTVNKRIISYDTTRYTAPKWLMFCKCMLKHKYNVYYYEARRTVSKYIYVENPRTDIVVKVRFSNHKPNVDKELKKDSTFYVGVFNFGIITTEMIIPKVVSVLNKLDNDGDI